MYIHAKKFLVIKWRKIGHEGLCNRVVLPNTCTSKELSATVHLDGSRLEIVYGIHLVKNDNVHVVTSRYIRDKEIL